MTVILIPLCAFTGTRQQEPCELCIAHSLAVPSLADPNFLCYYCIFQFIYRLYSFLQSPPSTLEQLRSAKDLIGPEYDGCLHCKRLQNHTYQIKITGINLEVVLFELIRRVIFKTLFVPVKNVRLLSIA